MPLLRNRPGVLKAHAGRGTESRVCRGKAGSCWAGQPGVPVLVGAGGVYGRAGGSQAGAGNPLVSRGQVSPGQVSPGQVSPGQATPGFWCPFGLEGDGETRCP
ncbi:hypothetical protein NCCP1664_01460 [Zafaria cholistanensis]|uniref:Uncharacterized protein n=1 Tax=Zafaria cholistanensis TaxID=1682741 RepID=A0A5A7NM61_9MICC|nr:hypothetical protein NCCP1664_01460 [Zafaria cholistanensis]